jgi:hypothetical protein
MLRPLSPDDLDVYARAVADALAHHLVHVERSHTEARRALIALDLSEEQADAVIDYAVECGIVVKVCKGEGMYLAIKPSGR